MTEGAAKWLISGMVQGVGFRWFVARQAQALGLRGQVANLPDGRVEVMAAGTTAALEQLEQQLKRGPRSARVDRVEKAEIQHDAVAFKSFEIS